MLGTELRLPAADLAEGWGRGACWLATSLVLGVDHALFACLEQNSALLLPVTPYDGRVAHSCSWQRDLDVLDVWRPPPLTAEPYAHTTHPNIARYWHFTRNTSESVANHPCCSVIKQPQKDRILLSAVMCSCLQLSKVLVSVFLSTRQPALCPTSQKSNCLDTFRPQEVHDVFMAVFHKLGRISEYSVIPLRLSCCKAMSDVQHVPFSSVF